MITLYIYQKTLKMNKTKNEDDPITKDDLKIEDNLKNKDDLDKS